MKDEYEWEYLEQEHFPTVFNKIGGANGYIQCMHGVIEKLDYLSKHATWRVSWEVLRMSVCGTLLSWHTSSL